eukprot:scaffold231_cov131-Isochrysis_galbana.AAC.3
MVLAQQSWLVDPCCATHLPFLITGSTPRLSVPLPDTSAASVAAEARYESDMEEDPRARRSSCRLRAWARAFLVIVY